MANKEIHELIASSDLSYNDVLAEQHKNGDTWLTRGVTFNKLGVFLNNVLEYASDLHTTDKTIIGAINEVKGVIFPRTLTAGSTIITITDEAITASSLIDVYTDPNIWYESIVVSVSGGTGTAVITFDEQASDVSVTIKVI